MLTLNWPQALGLLCVGLVMVATKRRYFSPISDIPGPFIASFTRLWHIACIIRGKQNLELVGLHEKHGHFVRIAPNEVSLSHPDSIRKVMLAPLHKGDWYKIVAFPDGRFVNTMSATDPKVKNELSKHLAPAYTLSNLIQSEPAFDELIEQLLGWLDAHAESGKPMDLDRFLTFATTDIVGAAIFSRPLGFLREGRDIDNTIANAHPQAAYVSVAGFFRWLHVLLLSNPVITWLGITPWGHIINSTMAAIRERRVKADSARSDAIAHWLRMLDRNPGRMQPHEVDSAAFNAMGAGNETVACALQAFVYLMIRRPDAWRRARRELQAIAPASRVVSYADAQALPFLQACIKEALRVFSPVAMTLPRIAPPDGLTVGDRTIPPGTIVSVSAWVMHHSREIWGPDAREFNPDRWLAPDVAQLEKYLMPFGAGYASCPGQNLAKIELSKICATLVRDYDIRQVDPAQEWSWKAFFTTAPTDWPCIIEKAANSAAASGV